MNLILLGPPGGGKGTQAERIVEKYGVPHIATGDILRDAVAKGTDLGKKAKEYMDRGELVPDDIVIGIVKERIKQPDCKGGFLLDGFPRTIKQAEALDDMLKDLERSVDAVIYIDVPEEEVVRRIAYRRTCKNCGAVYNLIYSPPKEDNKCDKCGGELYQRDDDREEVVRQRFKVYMENTAPLIEYYEKKGKLYRVDGTKSIDDVWKQIDEILQKAK